MSQWPRCCPMETDFPTEPRLTRVRGDSFVLVGFESFESGRP